MQFCPSAELTAAACLGCSCSAINCSNTDADFCVQELQNPMTYRVDRSNFALSRDSGKMKFITNNFTGTKKDAIKKKYHAYRSIWNCNQFGLERNSNSKNKSGSNLVEKTIEWKFWPPPMVPVPKGLKIPVQYVQEINTPISNDPCSPTESTPDSKRYYVAGEDEVVNLIKAQPQEELPNDYYLQGVLNKPESEFFVATPSKLLFFGTEVGQTYTTTIKVLNNGVIPRHISVLNPRNASIDIDWGASLGENTLVAPGLCLRILITFRPKTKEAVHDTIAIIVSDDGAIIIPVISEHLAPPILEMVEWDVGCCMVGNSRIVNFDITSRGGEGRFWILSEEEFLNETIDIPFLPESRQGVEILRIRGEIEELQKILGVRQLTAEESDQLRKLKLEWSELLIGKTSELPAKPFLISPSCFRLQKSQFITIKIQYRPGDPDYHIRKLVLLCDNGEVRWIAVKGIGIDRDKYPLVDIQGKWMAPPLDLPADLNTRLTINCGDLIAGEANSQGFTIKNNSCMPLYFFWAVRHLRVFDEPMLQTSLDSSLMELRREGLKSVEWKDYSDISTQESDLCSSLMPLKISPAQNVIGGHQVLDCVVTVHAPPKEGYYVTVISLFVQQLNESEEKLLWPVLKELEADFSSNNDPITYESIIETLPAKIYKKDIPKQNNMNSKATSANSALTEENPTNTAETISTSGKGDGPDVDVGIEMESGAGTILESSISVLLPVFSKETDTTTHRCDFTKTQIESVPFFHITPNEENLAPYDYKLVRSGSDTLDLEDDEGIAVKAGDGDTNSCNNFDGGKLNLNDGRIQIANIEFSQDQDQETHFSRTKISSSPFSPEEEYDDEEEEEEDPIEVWSGDFGEGAEGLFDLSTEYDSYPGEGYYDSFDDKKEPKKSEIAEALAKEGCVLAHQYRNAKSWLDVTSPLQPIEEIEVWLQTIPLQCWFEPPHLSGYGTFSNKVIRTIEFVNHTAYPVQLSMSHFVSSVGTITCRPYEASVESLQSILLRFSLDFRTHGNHEGRVKGTIKLPFATVPCWVPFRLQAQGPQLLIVTPFINFGLVLEGTEKSKTLVLKNNGSLRTKWFAKIRSTNLRDENLSELSFDNAIIEKERLIRAWPEWGTIEAYETVSIQIFLSADFGYNGSLSAACEITNEENPEDICYVTVLAHVQSTQVIVCNSKVLLQDAFIHLPNYSTSTNLQNLTTFSTPFKWLPPIGGLQEMYSVTVSPAEGIIPPRGSVTCVFEFLCNQSLLLTNLFIPCCVGGMKEPLLVKIEGTVFGACLKIVIPVTKFYRVREEDLPWQCHDDLWPRICGKWDEDEVPGEGGYYTNFLGMKYCVAKHETQAPPPSVIEPEVEEEEAKEEVDEGDSRVSDKEPTDKNRKRSKWKKAKGKKSVKPETPADDNKRPENKKGKKKSKFPIPPSTLDESVDNENSEEIKTIDLDSVVDEAESLEPSLFDVDSLIQKSGETEMLGEDYIGASFYGNLLAEDDENPDEVMRSDGRQIYLQIRKSGDIALVIFTVQNEAPMSTKYNFKVVNHPIQEPPEAKQPDFILLDDDFFQLMTYNLNEEPKKEDVLQGKLGAAFRVTPSEGILEPSELIEVTLEFHANLSGIYEDQLECHFEGMENPYIIRIEALAVICDQKGSLPTCTPPVVVPPKVVGKMF